MTVLHTASHVAYTSAIQPGVYAGGCPSDAQRRVTAGEASADDFTFYSGYAAWPIERLKEEVREGSRSSRLSSLHLLCRLSCLHLLVSHCISL